MFAAVQSVSRRSRLCKRRKRIGPSLNWTRGERWGYIMQKSFTYHGYILSICYYQDFSLCKRKKRIGPLLRKYFIHHGYIMHIIKINWWSVKALDKGKKLWAKRAKVIFSNQPTLPFQQIHIPHNIAWGPSFLGSFALWKEWKWNVDWKWGGETYDGELGWGIILPSVFRRDQSDEMIRMIF